MDDILDFDIKSNNTKEIETEEIDCEKKFRKLIDIPKDKNNKEIYLNKWKIYSNNKDIDLEFTPLIDRHDKADVLIIAQDAHQVFGLFNGKFKTNDGEIIIKDALGFAEKVKNRW